MTPGAPGVFAIAPQQPPPLIPIRRDVAAFAGVSVRGPARLPVGVPDDDADVATWLGVTPVARTLPVPIGSWEEYRHVFGGFAGPGRLPYAVSAFFAQGGARAYVLRLVQASEPVTSEGTGGRAFADLPVDRLRAGGSPVRLLARSEGSWGNGLRAGVRGLARALPLLGATAGELVLPAGVRLPAGSLLRLRTADEAAHLRFAETVRAVPALDGPSAPLHVTLGAALPSAPVAAELVDVLLEIRDVDPSPTRAETLAVGLHPAHPNWLARALIRDSGLLWPDRAWASTAIDWIDPQLAVVDVALSGGSDHWQGVVPQDALDPLWVPGDERPGAGVHSLAEVDDVGLLVVPDLYDPAPIVAIEDVRDPGGLAGPTFQPCVRAGPSPPPTPRPPGLDALRRDPALPSELAEILDVQAGLVTFAEQRRGFTVLLDVPPGLTKSRIMDWRNRFDSPYVAAYHPWLDVAAPEDGRDSLVRVNPSSFAAGIVADRELRLGISRGPANQVAVGAVRTAVEVPAAVHDELHLAGINVFLTERDGIRLSAGRTLSRRPQLRQLSVARLMTVLRLTLERELDWLVFEPNGPALWARVRRTVTGLLTRLHEGGAFTGATARESFFVRCDPTTMTAADLDAGRMICLVGVAPAEPLEYLVVQILRDADVSVRVETG